MLVNLHLSQGAQARASRRKKADDRRIAHLQVLLHWIGQA